MGVAGGTQTRGAMAESGGKQDLGIYLYAGALLVVCVGVSPIPGTLLSAGLPLLPEMPSLPSVELPDLPSIKMPDVTSLELPSLPSLTLPKAPSLPDMPSFQLPALPEIPSLNMPSIGLPLSVSSAISVVTDTASTAGKETKTVFISLWQKIAAWPLWRIASWGSQPTEENIEEKSDPVNEPETDAAEEEAAKIAEEATKVAAEEVAAAAAEEAARLAAVEAEKIAAEEKRQADAEAERVAAEAEAEKIAAEAETARIAAEEEAKRVSEEEQTSQNTGDAVDDVEKESKTVEESPKVEDQEENVPLEPTLGDIENIDNQAATVLVESVAKAAKDIVVNIIETAQDTEEAKAETVEKVDTPEEKAGG